MSGRDKRDAVPADAPRFRLPGLPGSVWESGGVMTLLTIAGSVILVAALVAVPRKGSEGREKNPAADAEAIRRTLVLQAGEHLEADEAPIASATCEESAGDATRAVRDLFNPVRMMRQVPSRRAAPAPPRLPRLSGVFIDGGNRIAVLNGGTLAEGDDVAGFRVHAILSDKVVLEREKELYTLDWKGVHP